LLLAVIDLLLGFIVLFLGLLLGVGVGLVLVQFVRIQLVLGLVKLILLLLFLLLLLLRLRGVEVVIVIGWRDVVAIPGEVLERLHRRREVLGKGAGRKGRGHRDGRRHRAVVGRVQRLDRRGCDCDLACARR
jgi:hypothetical protein